MTSGNIGFVLYRPLSFIELSAAGIANAVDYLTSGFPKFYNGTVPFLVFIPSTTTASAVAGQLVWTQGF
jgi:hypothetical protein